MTDKQIDQLNEQLGVIDDILEEILMRLTSIEDRIKEIELSVFDNNERIGK